LDFAVMYKKIFSLSSMLFFCFPICGTEFDVSKKQRDRCIINIHEDLKRKIACDYLDVRSIGRLGQTCKELEHISLQAYLIMGKDYTESNKGLERLIKKHERLMASKVESDNKDFFIYNNLLSQNKEIFDQLWKYHAEKRNREIGHFLQINNLTCNVDDAIVLELVEIFMNYKCAGACNHSYFPSLHAACRFGLPNIVKMLLDQGADIHQVSERYGTALHVASRNGYPEIIEILLSKGLDVNVVDNAGWTPLFLASTKVMQLLVDKGANVNAVNRGKSTSLHYECSNGRAEGVKILLDNGADANFISRKETPLFVACKNQTVAVVKVLLEHKNGANPNINTPLYLACWQGNVEIIKLLIKWKADVNCITEYGDAPIHAMCHDAVITEILLSNGADVNLIHAKNGKTALCYACEKGKTEVIKILLKNKANPQIADNNGKFPLCYAYENGATEIIELLLDNGAHPKT
jgi:ankyrin repeat protein